MKPFAILVAAVVSTAPMTAVQAQVANTPAIAAACTGAATSCAAIVRDAIAQLNASGLTGDALDAQLGQVAAAVQQGGANATVAGRAVAVAMMREVAVAVSDPAQAANIRDAAVDLEEGVLDPLPLAPLPASPA